MSAQAAKNLNARAAANPGEADAVMAETLLLRAEIWKIAGALREQHPADLSAVNKMIAVLPPQPRLLKRGDVQIHALKGIPTSGTALARSVVVDSSAHFVGRYPAWLLSGEGLHLIIGSHEA